MPGTFTDKRQACNDNFNPQCLARFTVTYRVLPKRLNNTYTYLNAHQMIKLLEERDVTPRYEHNKYHS